MKWFKNCETIEEVKARYKELVFQYHPDKSGKDTNKEMAEISKEYTEAAKKYKNVHKNAAGEKYEKESPDTAAEFKEIIDLIIRLENVKIEICGSWIWITGETKKYKEYLKEIKFRWAADKKAWYWHKDPYKKRTSNWTLEQIRDSYGSREVKTEEQKKIAK